MPTSATLMQRIAATDNTFSRAEGGWIGKCLICGGRLRFDDNGFGANVEHIVPRNMGGTNELLNLGLTHPRCNGEKGVHWDEPGRRRRDPQRYAEIVERLLAERKRRWRDEVPSTEY